MSDNGIVEPEIEPEMETGIEDEEGGVEETKGSESEVEEDEDEQDGEVEEPYEDEIVEEDDVELNDLEEVEDNTSATKTTSSDMKTDENYQPYEESDESDTSDSDSEDEYISKVDLEKKMDYIKETHTQEISKTYEEMIALTKIKRRKMKSGGDDLIDDDDHKTVPILTKYEKTRILGIRVSQLNEGAPRYINVNETIIDNNIIAEKELRMKKLPFIVTRPLPNGKKEHWRLRDLELLQ